MWDILFDILTHHHKVAAFIPSDIYWEINKYFVEKK